MSRGRKSNRGRPTDELKEKIVSIRVPSRTLIALDKMVKPPKIGRSEIIRQILTERLDVTANLQTAHVDKELILFQRSSLTWTGVFNDVLPKNVTKAV